jgi:hypothetical protein
VNPNGGMPLMVAPPGNGNEADGPPRSPETWIALGEESVSFEGHKIAWADLSRTSTGPDERATGEPLKTGKMLPTINDAKAF